MPEARPGPSRRGKCDVQSKRTGVFERGDLVAGRYEVQRLLGRGGMGSVYLVLDRKSNRKRALKTLLPQYARHHTALRRFIREVNAVRKLNHPCIVRIHDARKVDDLVFFTMDYCEGQSLRDLMRKRKTFGIGSTVRVLSLLCHALEHAHQHTIHRDISPENVMVLANGSIKLLDFGLAKLDDVDPMMTRIGVALGKEQYGAPEQRLDAKNVDLRADLYSLGIMFYEMLSGRLPRPGQRLTTLVPGLPQECDTLVDIALAQDRDQRFSSARALREALARIYEIAQTRRAGTTEAIAQPSPAPASAPAPAPAQEPATMPSSVSVRLQSLWKRLKSRLLGRRSS